MDRNLRDKADRLFAAAVRARGRCECCGVDGTVAPLECAHVVSRRYYAVRWSEENAVCLCGGGGWSCHAFFTANPNKWKAWCRGYGIDFDAILYRANTARPMDPADVVRRYAIRKG